MNCITINNIKMKQLLSIFIFFCIITEYTFGQENNQKIPCIENIITNKGNVFYYVKGLEKNFKVLFLSDTHFTVEDERGRSYYDYTKRMGGAAVEPENYGKSNGREQGLINSLEKAKKEEVELVILGGDIINFPSLASVERVTSLLDSYGLKWVFTSGNHDWHYEGESGDLNSLRAKWVKSNLKSFYPKGNPMFSSIILHNINFVLIDNSTYEVSNEQLNFLQNEIKKGFPVILSMHIPIYLSGHDIEYGCGHPDWNSKHDNSYKIERRLAWPDRGHTKTTNKFRDLVLNDSSIISIYAGHTHEEAIDFYKNKLQYVTGANYNNSDVIIHFESIK